MNTISKDSSVDEPNHTMTHFPSISPASLDSEKAIIVQSGSSYSSYRTGIPDRRCTTSNPPMDSSACSSNSTTNNVSGSHLAERLTINDQLTHIINVSNSQSAECVINSASPATQSRPQAPVPTVRKPAKYPSYRTEPMRLQSYSSWPRITPTAEECVIAGFFYTGDSDLIRCFQCGIGLKNFSEADNPMVEHIKNAKSCLYLEAVFGPVGLGRQLEEIIKLDQENVRQRHYEAFVRNRGAKSGNQADRHPQYNTLESRLLTFKSDNFRCTKLPQELAEAGLYYTGVGDNVRCFSCNGGLRNWEDSDDPWTEHCKWFPECGFARESKGEAFIERVQRNINKPTTMLNTTSNPTGRPNANNLEPSNPTGRPNANNLEPSNPTGRPNANNLEPDLKSLKNTCTVDMGFASDVFDKAVEHLKLEGYNTPNIEDIINRIDQVQRDSIATQSRANTATGENKRLKSMLTCSKCRNNDSNALFLPCAHHVMCIECARDLKRCSVCKRAVDEVVRTYMS